MLHTRGSRFFLSQTTFIPEVLMHGIVAFGDLEGRVFLKTSTNFLADPTLFKIPNRLSRELCSQNTATEILQFYDYTKTNILNQELFLAN